jgi:hypothetical protein
MVTNPAMTAQKRNVSRYTPSIHCVKRFLATGLHAEEAAAHIDHPHAKNTVSQSALSEPLQLLPMLPSPNP